MGLDYISNPPSAYSEDATSDIVIDHFSNSATPVIVGNIHPNEYTRVSRHGVASSVYTEKVNNPSQTNRADSVDITGLICIRGYFKKKVHEYLSLIIAPFSGDARTDSTISPYSISNNTPLTLIKKTAVNVDIGTSLIANDGTYAF